MPEVEEVEPLQRMALHARFQMTGVTLHGLLDPRLATAALDGAAVIEGREIDPETRMGAALFANAAQGIDVTAQQRGQHEGPLREGRGLIDEVTVQHAR